MREQMAWAVEAVLAPKLLPDWSSNWSKATPVHSGRWPLLRRSSYAMRVAFDMETAPLKLPPATERTAMAPVVLKGVSIDYSAIDEALRLEEPLINADYSTVEMHAIDKLLRLGRPSGLNPERLADLVYKRSSVHMAHEVGSALANFKEAHPELVGYFSSRGARASIHGRL